ncbi:hypothetical protein Hanom_Chr01g00008501 [Helianthus anomalus]
MVLLLISLTYQYGAISKSASFATTTHRPLCENGISNQLLNILLRRHHDEAIQLFLWGRIR